MEKQLDEELLYFSKYNLVLDTIYHFQKIQIKIISKVNYFRLFYRKFLNEVWFANLKYKQLSNFLFHNLINFNNYLTL